MDWGQFWTIILQVLIASGVLLGILFVGSAVVAGIKEGQNRR